MGVTVNGGALKKFTFNNQKVKKWTHNGVKVWSGATVVSYYDGLTLIGRLEVDEGADVLHPPISIVKSGYTHVGWTYNGSRVTSLTAQGETMTVTAVFVPNSITVVSGGWNGPYYASPRWYAVYSGSVNSEYVSGSVGVSVTSYHDTRTDTFAFTLDMKEYQTASISMTSTKANDDDGYGIFDGTHRFSSGIIGGGSHSGTVYSVSGSGGGCYAYGVGSLVLSNPKPWT